MAPKSFTNQEYLELLQKLVDSQYDDAIEDYNIDDMEWIPSEPEIIKKKKKEVNHNVSIDLTNVKARFIEREVHRYGTLKVGDFKIIIFEFNEDPDGYQPSCNLKVVVHQSQTMNGFPCNMDTDLNITKDDRFQGRPWLKYFSYNRADGVPIDTVVEIVRWMQVIKKLTAFL